MKVKKMMAALAACAMMVAGAAGGLPGTLLPDAGTVLTARAEEIDGLTYIVLYGGTITITGCDESLTSVEIPAEIDGKAVTSISRSAFKDCTELASITIPDSVTKIEESAFDNTAWYNAQPDGVVYVGKVLYAYKGEMPDNTSVVVRDGTAHITDYAFRGCTGLTSIAIPDSVTSIKTYAFYGCTGLTSIAIPDGVTEIGNSAFSGCTGLTRITLPDSLTGIGCDAFSGCTGLTKITIPNSVTGIGNNAFIGCTGLTDITIFNPDCELGEDYYITDGVNDFHINNGILPADTTIHGYEGSTAQAYVETREFGNPFVLIGETSEEPLYGDANDDGEVTIVDVVKVCRSAMGADTLTEAGAVNADVDKNGTTDATDASYIIQSLVGLVTLPVEN